MVWWHKICTRQCPMCGGTRAQLNVGQVGRGVGRPWGSTLTMHSTALTLHPSLLARPSRTHPSPALTLHSSPTLQPVKNTLKMCSYTLKRDPAVHLTIRMLDGTCVNPLRCQHSAIWDCSWTQRRSHWPNVRSAWTSHSTSLSEHEEMRWRH